MRVGFNPETNRSFFVTAPPAGKGEVFEGSAPRPLPWVAVAAPVGSWLAINGHGDDSGGASSATQLDPAHFAGPVLGGGSVSLANAAAEIGRTSGREQPGS